MNSWVLSLLLVFVIGSSARAERIELAGKWERWIGGSLHDLIPVPSSYRPVGTAVLRRSFDLPVAGANRRVLLRFEGITHRAEVRVNGADVGRMGPWTPYTFDITAVAHARANTIEVEVTDWQVPLGPIGAWEASGGIIRDVYIEIRPDPYVANAHLQYKLEPDSVHCNLGVYVVGQRTGTAKLRAELWRDGAKVSEAIRILTVSPGENRVPLEWDLKSPLLWTPDSPLLYDLRVRLETPAGEDVFEDETGFRSLSIEGNKFLINGRDLVLHGVCRHDIWKDQGHTMTQVQIDQDLSMIKAMGANFIRLVHYPHDRRVVRSAARLGLLVTEESGLVWLQFKDISRETLETGLGNLERVIRRDWNSPALFAVLLANESSPTLEAIKEGRQRIRTLKPELFMSSAHISGDYAESKRLFDEGGLDFYTTHTYGFDMKMFARAVDSYPGKPVVFTEWGGRAIGQSPVMMRATTDQIGALVEQGKLAGYSFWSWADLPEFSRVDEEMDGGILKSGVVEEDRTPRPDVYLALSALYRRTAAPARFVPGEPRVLAGVGARLSAANAYIPVPLQSILDTPSQSEAWNELEVLMERFFRNQGFTQDHWNATGGRFWLWNAPKLLAGGIPFETPLHDGASRPVVLTPRQRKLEIPAGMRASYLHFLGNVTLPDGYPVIGKLNGQVGRYVIVYEDGERQTIPLRWGREVARSNMIAVASRIDPVTSTGERVLVYEKDPVREVHQARLLTVQTMDKPIARIRCELDVSEQAGTAPPMDVHHSTGIKPGLAEQALVIFAITAESRK